MEYIDISIMFERLNNFSAEYLVLRNYDKLLEDSIYMAGHGDIDMLCRDVKQVVEIIGAKPFHPAKGPLGDKTHFYIYYKGQKVSIDLRVVGDNYYCKKWENEMLRTRKKHECFYVMDDENQYYSLIYHAIFQKPSLSEEYRLRLSNMAKSSTYLSERNLIIQLEEFMRKKGYQYVYAKDHFVRTRNCMQDRDLLEYHWKEKWPHVKFELYMHIISFLVKLKHLILGKQKI